MLSVLQWMATCGPVLTHVPLYELSSATILLAYEDPEKGRNGWFKLVGFWSCHVHGILPTASRPYRLDGQQATKFEVLNHRELLQTLNKMNKKKKILKMIKIQHLCSLEESVIWAGILVVYKKFSTS